MREDIKRALYNLNDIYGEDVFSNPKRLIGGLNDLLKNELALNLLTIAIINMDSYARMKNSQLLDLEVNTLINKMIDKYSIAEENAKVVIECIAELLGYIPPVSISTQVQTQIPIQTPVLTPIPPTLTPTKNTNITMLFWLLFGLFGGHRFYLGKPLTAFIFIAIIFFAIASVIIGMSNPTEIIPAISFVVLSGSLLIYWVADLLKITHGNLSDGKKHKIKKAAIGWRILSYIIASAITAFIIWIGYHFIAHNFL
jgi:TM2 domain-containing membrane protein YozV